MNNEQHRYFIELQPHEGTPVSRSEEALVRRQQAERFVEEVGAWLQREAMESKVLAMAVTALGQVQITCEADVISQIRTHDEERIAAIRQGATYVENMGRWAGR